MIEKISFNPIAFKSYDSTPNVASNPIDNQPRDFNSDFYIDKKGVEAIKAKTFVANPIDIDKPISMNDYVNKLTKAGLIEGKDFEIIKDSKNGGGSIYITKGQEKLFKVVHWNEGSDIKNYDGYENFFYPINKEDLSKIAYRYDSEGYLEEKWMEYNNPDIHKNLFPENIDITTTSEEYLKMLDSKNIKYDIEKTPVENQGTMTSIWELNNENQVEKEVTFFEYPNGEKTIFYADTP